MKISNSDHSVDVTPEDLRCFSWEMGEEHLIGSRQSGGHPAPVPCCRLAEMMRRGNSQFVIWEEIM